MRSKLSLAALVLCAFALPVSAERLTADVCEQLRTEQDKLAGSRGDMQRGPDWARANLPPDRLAKIRRLIEVEEQITFRCQRPQLAAPASVQPHAPAAEAESEPPRKRKKAQKPKAEPNAADAKAEAADDTAKPAAKAAAPATGDEPAPKKAKGTKRAKPSGESAAAPGDGEPSAKPAVKTQ